VILRRRRLASFLVPPISVVLARDKARYIEGLTLFRDDRVADWIEVFAAATAQAAIVATRYVEQVAELQEGWRDTLRSKSDPRADAAAWVLIDVLPAHPIITLPVGMAATKRSKPAVSNGITELEEAGVLERVSKASRNRAWEATGLLELIEGLESGK
jgi:hypothetical protein